VCGGGGGGAVRALNHRTAHTLSAPWPAGTADRPTAGTRTPSRPPSADHPAAGCTTRTSTLRQQQMRRGRGRGRHCVLPHQPSACCQPRRLFWRLHCPRCCCCCYQSYRCYRCYCCCYCCYCCCYCCCCYCCCCCCCERHSSGCAPRSPCPWALPLPHCRPPSATPTAQNTRLGPPRPALTSTLLLRPRRRHVPPLRRSPPSQRQWQWQLHLHAHSVGGQQRLSLHTHPVWVLQQGHPGRTQKSPCTGTRSCPRRRTHLRCACRRAQHTQRNTQQTRSVGDPVQRRATSPALSAARRSAPLTGPCPAATRRCRWR
jgi:hypothetical protein